MIGRIIRNTNKEGLKKGMHLLSKKCFKAVEKYFSVHITPAHYYSPIPITNELDLKVYEKIYDCTGIDWNLAEQQEYLRSTFPKYLDEYTPVLKSGLSLVDAFALYAMIREKRPSIMIEVGAGESTKVSLAALKKNRNEGIPFKFYSVEPFPRDDVRQIQDNDFKLIDHKLQDVEISLLSSADIFFIDSSHVSKIDSDVNYEILEVIPKLKIGSIIHWHDIVIPKNYWKEWIDEGNMFWNESYMVHSFMLFNSSFKVMWAARYMQLNYYAEMQERFSFLRPDHHLMSFWIRRIL